MRNNTNWGISQFTVESPNEIKYTSNEVKFYGEPEYIKKN